MSLKLGVPSKGRLMEKTFDWFAERGVRLALAGGEREYAGRVDGIDGIELVLLSAGEIPRELAAGRIHLGVTGTDLIREKLGQWEQRVEELAELGFGHADLIIAVPQAWVMWTRWMTLTLPPLRSARSTVFVFGLRRSITALCATICATVVWRIISLSTAKGRPKAL